jgi:hypothetical protein
MESEEGWAVEMKKDGEAEPALVELWEDLCDDLPPRPLDAAAFKALHKSAEALQSRQRQRLQSQLHKRLSLHLPDGRWEVTLDIVPDEFEPHAVLTAFDAEGTECAHEKVAADFKLTPAIAESWISSDFRRSAEA